MTTQRLFARAPESKAEKKPSRRGRRPSSEIQSERDKHVKAAFLLYVRRLPWEMAILFFEDVSRSQLYEWARKAQRYPEFLAACQRAGVAY